MRKLVVALWLATGLVVGLAVVLVLRPKINPSSLDLVQRSELLKAQAELKELENQTGAKLAARLDEFRATQQMARKAAMQQTQTERDFLAYKSQVVSLLTEPLGHQDTAVRRWAAEVLGKRGAEARAAVPALREALKDADTGVRSAAAEALELLDPDAAANTGVP